MTPLLPKIWLGIVDPRASAHDLFAQKLSRDAMWTLLVLLSISTVLFRYLAESLGGLPSDATILGFTPLVLALILTCWQIIVVFCIFFTGRSLGGTGTFGNTLRLMVWLQVILFALEIVQIGSYYLSNGLGQIVAFLAVVLIVRCLVIFIDVLHGFDHVVKSAICLAIAFLGPIIGLSLIASLIGITTPGGGPNV